MAGWALDGQVGALALRSPLSAMRVAGHQASCRGEEEFLPFGRLLASNLRAEKGGEKKKKKDKENEVFKGKMQYFPCGRSGKMEHLEGLSQICSQRGLVKLC